MSGLLIQFITNVIINSTTKIIETPSNILPSRFCWKGGKAINDYSLIDRIMPRNARAAKSEKEFFGAKSIRGHIYLLIVVSIVA